MPEIRNVHSRTLPVAPERLSPLIDGLGSPDDRLWPHGRWPALRLGGGLREGARGGHGPVRYRVSQYQPGRRVVFAFDPDHGLARGFDGEHRFEISPVEGGAELRHAIEARCGLGTWLRWALVIRPLHDALLEDALDRAVAAVTGMPTMPRPHSWRVRVLRSLARRGKRGEAQDAQRPGSDGADG